MTTNQQPSKRIGIVNDSRGGITYAQYLKSILGDLPKDWSIVVYNTNRSGMTDAEAEAFFELPVTSVTHQIFWAQLRDIDCVIGNDPVFAQFVDDSIITIMLPHGAAPRPAGGPKNFFAAEWVCYLDAVLTASKTIREQFTWGLKRYRRLRRAMKLNISPTSIRSDMRETRIMPTKRLKYLDSHNEGGAVTTDAPVIGFLPTLRISLYGGLTIYDHIGSILNQLREDLPKAKVLFRPYLTDISDGLISSELELLKQTPNAVIDDGGGNVNEFLDQCDIVISDGSVGAISFMMKKCITPIYFIPVPDEMRHFFDDFYTLMNGTALIAEDPKELVDSIKQCMAMAPDEHLARYKRYCEKELFDNDPATVIRHVVEGKTERLAEEVAIDAFGQNIKP